eukprot:GHVN01066984.1.p1 GENE.GHVN01066984.1~~GHVN01066984.1.p1  ORF type:complete len:963 (+),score=79.61 GHVN01066984.1:2247-5135(+)
MAPNPHKRRDHLRTIEHKVQKHWQKLKAFEVDAPANYGLNISRGLAAAELAQSKQNEKFFCTFCYPYMNGMLHMGHAFTVTKAEFAARYNRLLGKEVLWPFGLHCTGMPIQAAADKLKREASEGEGHQWGIMKSMGIDDSEIPSFQNAQKWLEYFPPRALTHLQEFGLSCDWRRSFITTDANPYYDAFIRWQFRKLKARGKIDYGMRPAVFSRVDHQPCADHDRVSGEGSTPQEYTIVKMEVQLNAGKGSGAEKKWPSEVTSRKVFLVAATLRPETMYGQTNCFLLPDGNYKFYLAFTEPDQTTVDSFGVLGVQMTRDEAFQKCSHVYVCSDRAAANMGFQGTIPMDSNKTPFCIHESLGQDIMGLPLSAPYASYETIYTLPMMGISMDKGTGVVTSVPSDSPDDFCALRDLQNKEALRQKYNIEAQWCSQDVVEIIGTPGYGNRAAVQIVEEFKIKSQNDKVQLAEAKEKVYKAGFYEGVMLVGNHKGKKVAEVKNLVRTDLLSAGLAVKYWEPEKKVVSRSGDTCVVALCNQWYLDYGEEKWRDAVLEHVQDGNRFNPYNETTAHQFTHVLHWLSQWACSRHYGLGTRIPWDEEALIESLSDSTIYMAYYSIAHLLQSNLNGSEQGLEKISVDELTDDVMDYIFLQSDTVPKSDRLERIKRCRSEFMYWYPMDLRVSAKDLIFNHLTMCLYNHSAIWDDQPHLWPKGFFCNGYVLVDSQKMSKSVGNFITIKEAVDTLSADATRVALADAGDTLDDANFSRDTANTAIMKLYLLDDFVQHVIAGAELVSKLSPEDSGKPIAVDTGGGASLYLSVPQEGKLSLADNCFINEICHLVSKAQDSYDAMRYRDALKFGFFDFQRTVSEYRMLSGADSGSGSMKLDLILKAIKAQAIILSPFAPHLCEHLWECLCKSPAVSQILKLSPDSKSAKQGLIRSCIDSILCCGMRLKSLERTRLKRRMC